jgi:hypothetical protein
MKQAYAGMTDGFYVIHSGGEPFYNQRCPNCHVWTKGTSPSEHCSKCQTTLPHHLHPLARTAEAPDPEYGIISPDMTPETNLKSLELATSLTAPLSNKRAAQVYRLANLTPLLWWLTMIVAPKWRGTRALTTSRGLFAGLGLFYSAFLLKAITEEGPPNYGTYEKGPRRLFTSNATDIPVLWAAASTTDADRKEIIRQIVERVIVDVQGSSERVKVRIEWIGGGSSEGAVIRPIGKLSDLSPYPQICQRVQELTEAGWAATAIAQALSDEGNSVGG